MSAGARHRISMPRTTLIVTSPHRRRDPESAMGTNAISFKPAALHPVRLRVVPDLTDRNRLTVAFRCILAIPHLLLVGGPIAAFITWSSNDGGVQHSWGAGGVLGAVAFVCAIIAWFAIVFTAEAPNGLWKLSAFYLRWRVRSSAYMALLRDEYPPFGDGEYPVEVDIPVPLEPRDRLGVAFRPILAIPHLIAVWALGLAWAVTIVIAWFAILFTGSYPRALYEFGLGVLRWTTRVEAYLLLLVDAYPPFTLD
jgi:hypothetical protein